jgi:hypothetical protein
MPPKILPKFLRFSAFAVGLAAGVVVARALVRAANGQDVADNLVLAVVALALGVALAALVNAVAHLVTRGAGEMPPELSRGITRMQVQLDAISGRVLEVREQTERVAQVQQAMYARHDEPREAPPPMALAPSDLEPVHQALRDLRDLVMLTDAERKERIDRYRQERRAGLIKQAFDMVSARQWHNAERLVLGMETEFPSDDEVAKVRNYLNHARKLNEEETVTRTVREIEDLIAAASWDQALARARSLVEGFPDNGPAHEVLHRVQREREAYYESTVARMFDELRHDIDRRMWRRAFMHAQHLLERFPTHSRADSLRRQLKTLQDNAEIEERQELEVRIQELVKAQRFEEAIALGEDLIRRYPMSPQAESLDTLLPRLRELADQGVEDFVAPSPDVDVDEDVSPAHRTA